MSEVHPSAGRGVRVDPDLCEGHALCLFTAPEIFELDDDEVSTVVATPSPEQWDAVAAAISACPRGAILVDDEPQP